MASPSLSHLLHADPSQSQPHSPSQPQPPQRHVSSHTSAAHSHPATSSPGNYTYPAPPGVSPAASGTSHPTPIATPATSPSAPSTTGGSTVGAGSSVTPSGHAANTSLYQCADCLKRYSRPEHLQRHIATHTLGKRFICDVRPRILPRVRFSPAQSSPGTAGLSRNPPSR